MVARLLDHFETGPGRPIKPSESAGAPPRRQRAVVGQILPEREYWVPVLRALTELGGTAPAVEVIDRVGELLEQRLTPLDREDLDTGEVRWRKRTQFARFKMVGKGLLRRDVPRGVWAITSEGESYLAAHTEN